MENNYPKKQLQVNGKGYTVQVDGRMPLLWVLRDELGLSGTKYGCGIGQCGACTVLEDGQAIRACLTPVSQVKGKITTIEGLGCPDALHLVQEAWIETQVAQCGYCQSGQILSAHTLLQTNPEPTDEDIDSSMVGNLCRCGTYPRIREAIHLAAQKIKNQATPWKEENS